MPIRIVLADTHALVLMGLDRLFENEPRFQVVGRVSTPLAALDRVREQGPDVLVMDFLDDGREGLGILQQLQKERTFTRVIILTAGANEREILEAIRLGADGVVLKEMAPRLLLDAVQKVHKGGRWVETDLAARTMQEMLKRDAAIDRLACVLTGREIEVARQASVGLSNAKIAERLHISEGTVKLHLHHIYAKLHVAGRVDLTAYAREIGLV
jgi:DNA-binding NarL/FixJ family response regulator